MQKKQESLPRSCFIYVNVTKYNGADICKVGYSFNPDKRMLAFNCGLKHRYRNGFIDKEVRFQRFFSIKADDQKICKKIERVFINRYKDLCLNQFGSEVFAIDPISACYLLSELATDQ